MSSIPRSYQKLIRGMKRAESEKPDAVSQERWDAIPQPPLNKRDEQLAKTANCHWRNSNRHTNRYVLERYVREQREAMGVGYYPLREKWACKPEGLAVSLPHLKCMEEPTDETHGGTINLRSEKTTAQD